MQEKESRKRNGKEKEMREDSKEREKEKQRLREKEKEVREDFMELSKEKEKQGKEKEVREDGKDPSKKKQKQRGKEKEVRDDGKDPTKEKQKQKGKEKGVRNDGKDSTMEKQKQKGKEMETVRDEDKKKEKGKQQGKEKELAKNIGQQFFKIFFPNLSRERLKIPVSFHKYLKEQPTGLVSLKGPSGNTWQATLTSDSEGLCFGHGWKEFVMDHLVKQGHLFMFTYDGLSRFSVMVFSSSGVMEPLALAAKPTNNILIKIKDIENVQGDMYAGGTSQTSILPQEESNGITGKGTRGVNESLLDGNASKRHSSVAKKAEKKRPEAIVCTSKDASTIINTEKDTTFSLFDESMASNKTQIRDKNVPKLGKFVVKRARLPVVISQRRPVTQEEKDFALRRAKEFKSKNPFAVQTMMESYVYVGFFMNITCEFVRESLPQTSKKMTLWGPLGKPWEVNYVYYSEHSVASFSGGWGKFALGNNLGKFDVCIFELFKEDNIKVHIYRVVPEITQLLRASSKD